MIDPTQTSSPPPPITTTASTPPASGSAPKPNLDNRWVQRAILYNEQTLAQAQRLAAATSQPPANMQDLTGKPDRIAAAWNFSPSATPAQDFWAQHDQALQQNMAQVPPNAPPEVITAAHNDAETKALNAIFPYRAELMGVGTKVIDDQVAQADRIQKIVDGHLSSLPVPVPPVEPAPLLPPAPPPPAQMPAPVPGGPL